MQPSGEPCCYRSPTGSPTKLARSVGLQGSGKRFAAPLYARIAPLVPEKGRCRSIRPRGHIILERAGLAKVLFQRRVVRAEDSSDTVAAGGGMMCRWPNTTWR